MARGTVVTRIQKDGSKRYYAVMRASGRQRWKGFDRKKDAEKFLDRSSTDLREGTYRELKHSSFANYVEQWKAKHLHTARLKPATLNSYGSNLAKHLVPALGHYPLTAITADEITGLEASLLKSGQSPKSTRNLLNLLNKILDDARRDGYIRVSPMTDVKLSPLTRKEGIALSPGDVGRLLDHSSGPLKLIILVGLLAGLRRNEIFALTWKDVSWDENLIHVRRNLFWRYGRYQETEHTGTKFVFHLPKTRSSIRSVDLSPLLKKALREAYLASDDKAGLIFQTAKGTPLDPGNVSERWMKPAARSAGLEGVTLHTLRHTFGSIKLEQGENLIYVSRQMGHATPSITANVYAHLIRERKPEAAARTDAFLFGDKPAVR